MYDGMLNVYKEPGYTSFDVVAKLRGILQQKKIGHTGTLDPQAEGVLAVCLGKATRLCDIMPDHDKEYEATLLLGLETDTEDTTGQILRRRPVTVEEEEVRQAMASFTGTYEQVPPMYSARKVNGQKLYELARQGTVVERPPRPVTIYCLEVLDMDLPRVRFRLQCSRGTYVRSLCRDIGAGLGCGGCMERLVRTKACGFSLSHSLRLSEIRELEACGGLQERIVPIDAMYPDYPRVRMNQQGDKLLYNGNKFRRQHIAALQEGTLQEETEPRYLVYDSGDIFRGIYVYDLNHQEFRPYKMFL